MSAQSRDQLGDLERHRLRLEEQIAKLRKSLQHWQTWDAEYEGLKEEIQGFKKTSNGREPTAQDMVQLGREFGGELVNEKEIMELLGKDMSRNANQVVDLISRRQDYVQKNVETVQKQVDAAEDKLSKVLIISNPSLEDEEGGPLMDIREELDEEGNVISSSISQPGNQAAQIMETLKKAGIDLPDEENKNGEGSSKIEEISDDAKTTPAKAGSEAKAQEAAGPSKASGKAPVQAESSSTSEDRVPRRKKSVSFTPDTKAPAASSGVGEINDTVSAHMNFKPGSRVVELNDKDEIVRTEIAGPQNPGIQNPVIPKNESEEDSKLRREMLEYSLNEVGHVVAEMNLEDGSDDDYDYEEEDSDIEEVEEDDEWGRSRPVITEEYLQKMRELEKKLDAQMIENLGPAPEDANLNNMLQQAQGVHKLVVRTDEEIPPALLPQKATKPKESTKPQNDDKTTESAPAAETITTASSSSSSKGVRFADAVDVAPAPKPASDTLPQISTEPRPIADAIIERSSAATSSSDPSTPPPRKTSRFKAARAAHPQTPIATSFPSTILGGKEKENKPNDDEEADEEILPRRTPTGPPNATLASTIVERDHNAANPSAPDPDGLDPATLSQEALTSYHKLRAKMIQRQEGGFVRPSLEEQEATGGEPLVEEREDGSVRKVSRFRAARVRAAEQGGGI
ncbi:Udp-galactose transporter like protein [Lasiodiplodia theobromae]|uniref:Spindle assembly abnormal protein 6 n=1 Tax=Lasiodiplodia theobromae TaxID=45133 RepID=A0A5N5DAK5_9PEZI|nr:Udp-galactose transporter like protein [Lasiodiplodia theobromae]KAB2574789.1 Spindle assembly abnormal protein 6 [Lasiodiplodia theobromae]KAF4543208.1 Udp-galactose transporter like protein [Lasiodiplodia theobromae]